MLKSFFVDIGLSDRHGSLSMFFCLRLASNAFKTLILSECQKLDFFGKMNFIVIST